MAELEASTAASDGDRLRKASGGVLCAFTLLLIGVLAFSIRLFSVRSIPLILPRITFRTLLPASIVTLVACRR
jgi:hypothetical protein